jgi:hypothetical protein
MPSSTRTSLCSGPRPISAWAPDQMVRRMAEPPLVTQSVFMSASLMWWGLLALKLVGNRLTALSVEGVRHGRHTDNHLPHWLLLVTFAAYAPRSAWPILKHPRTIIDGQLGRRCSLPLLIIGLVELSSVIVCTKDPSNLERRRQLRLVARDALARQAPRPSRRSRRDSLDRRVPNHGSGARSPPDARRSPTQSGTGQRVVHRMSTVGFVMSPWISW